MKPHFSQPADIKVAVVGYGGIYNMGRIHLQDVQKAGMTPRAAVELDAERLALAPKDFPGIQTYHTVEEMLAQSDVNLVILITPHNTHAPLALQCIAAGRHVVCEKPFAITTLECDTMIAAAEKAGVMLSTFHNRHWDGSVMKALEVVRSGLIGDIVRIECHMGQWNKPGDIWRASKSISGGILYDWGVHLLEYGLQLIQAEITEVTGYAKCGFWNAQTKWQADTIEDEGFAVVRFNNGAWLSLCITHIDANPKRGMFEVTGTKGSMVFEYDSHEIIVRDADKTVVTKGKNPKEQWERFYANIADHLTKGEALVITPEWARRPIHILDLADQSAREGRAITARYR
ncbi:MAG: Gfo/Idh/MocA family oxidoreductase [Cephaloticoccus sp.]|nr:Gfo/Idh/MocA family oxidoreductase [Cephaloticoccus sp.]MCF7761486.1 Gfo/Idh/MocA family oxidoreductase [Cephaloticoccus sp.]